MESHGNGAGVALLCKPNKAAPGVSHFATCVRGNQFKSPWYRSYQDAGTTDLAEAGDTRAHSHLCGMLTAHGPSVLFDDGEFR